jgi:nucleoside-diphosphate-sugar epimerase
MNYILGASGFLGKHLSQKVDCIAIPHEEIQDKQLKPFEKLFYLASYGNLIDQTDVQAIVKANVRDVISILDKAIEHDFKSFVYISTSSVKLRTQTTYSRAKRAIEEILLAYLERYNKPICIIRPFSITGIGEQQQHLIPTLIRSCLENEQINFVEAPKHDFIDVDDVVSGILNLADHSARGIFELGTGVSHSNREVLDIVEKVTGKKAKVNIVSVMRNYDSDQWVSNNFRARSWGWMPKKDLELSIREMVKDYGSSKKKNT